MFQFSPACVAGAVGVATLFRELVSILARVCGGRSQKLFKSTMKRFNSRPRVWRAYPKGANALSSSFQFSPACVAGVLVYIRAGQVTGFNSRPRVWRAYVACDP